MRWILLTIVGCLAAAAPAYCQSSVDPSLAPLGISEDQTHFIRTDTGERFVVWGVNYDHNAAGELLDEYWIDRWDEVVEDFEEIRLLGANCVRIHLQLGKFLDSHDRANPAALDQLRKLLELAEQQGFYLDITGLACYHKANIPEWYDRQSEQERWRTQAFFWESVASVCRDSPAVFCYDLMNEPILAGKTPESEWLGGELDGKFFTQRLTLDMAGRSRQEVAGAWVSRMVDAIKKEDDRHLVTVGVIPWVFVFGGGKPLFYSPEVGARLDFVSVHFYPNQGEVAEALEALRAYDIGKPLVVEEMFPLKCSEDELVEFIEKSAEFIDGWISFYWGQPAEQLRQSPDASIAHAITASWLDRFHALAAEVSRDWEAPSQDE
ncbi:cellulase family glycosylhydrolase [Allorhodopirellula solitaria]|uniref:Cellulase (Glycosyl hydrolase family 5) n=1 Tax=Allorhodopirellula solitaria TaxID=2527987 RepID=A0A5C5YG83_9BACT|nr:cellulase family glycosylhydrolase [Allorhodopirellula solitaria]TWT73893.1 Cellulase (glycosyl hydrolase family 5) [Allorhodopirellula solitaria]